MVRRVFQFIWAGVTVLLVVLHIVVHEPFARLGEFAVLVGLVVLAGQSILGVWRWADLSARKGLLWLLNSSVNWTLEVRLRVQDPVEDADISVLLGELQASRPEDRVFRNEPSDVITIDLDRSYSLTVRPVQSQLDTWWVVRFKSVTIGYRDGIHVLQRVFMPVVDTIRKNLEHTEEELYAIEARFNRVNPYAAVLLNELRVDAADQVFLSFRHDDSTVRLTKECVTVSSQVQAQAIYAMSAIFGLSLRGSFHVNDV